MAGPVIAGRRASILRRLLLAVALLWCVAHAGPARADVVDEAYARGNEAAARGDWPSAIEHYQDARRLLPGASAVLEHDLGVAYGNDGQIGPAAYHLRLALRSQPDDEVSRASRRSLGILRRRAELQAAATGVQISSPEGSSDLLLSALAARGIAWLTMIAGWALLAVLGLRWIQRRRGSAARATTAFNRLQIPAAIVLALVFVLGGVAHLIAVAAEAKGERAIVLSQRVEVREGPGAHRNVSFELQGSSRVRVVEQSAGWCRVRVPGGLEGWVKRDTLGLLTAAPQRGSGSRN